MVEIYDANAFLRQSLNRTHLGGVPMSPRLVFEKANRNPNPEIWVWDGANNNERRRRIFPGYKIRDYSGQENIFAGLRLYRQVLAHSVATQVEVPEWEADDVCATLARHFVARGEQVTIFTNDFDFHQLADAPGITLKGVANPQEIPPRYVPLYKAMRGDPSDKIPGIPGFGPKAWASFSSIYDVLDRAMRERDANTLRGQPFKPSVRTWLQIDENIELVFDYYQITQFYDVPLDEINAHIRPGNYNPAGAQEIFGKFIL